VNSGDGIDYHQRFGENIGDLIQVGLGSINPADRDSSWKWSLTPLLHSTMEFQFSCQEELNSAIVVP